MEKMGKIVRQFGAVLSHWPWNVIMHGICSINLEEYGWYRNFFANYWIIA